MGVVLFIVSNHFECVSMCGYEYLYTFMCETLCPCFWRPEASLRGHSTGTLRPENVYQRLSPQVDYAGLYSVPPLMLGLKA